MFFHGQLPQTSGFQSAKQIFVANFRFTSQACILSERIIFCTHDVLHPWGGRITAGSNGPGAFLVINVCVKKQYVLRFVNTSAM